MQIIIGLGYRKRVGKDTAADYLCDAHNFKKLSFATPLKILCGHIEARFHRRIDEDTYFTLVNGWRSLHDKAGEFGAELKVCYTITQFGHPNGEDNFLMTQHPSGKYRDLLQYVGTELFRAKDSMFWIRTMREKVDNIDKNKNIVITDMRFGNEKKFVEAIGYGVLIERATGLSDSHRSETSLDSAFWFFTLDNNGEVKDLYNQLDCLVEEIKMYQEMETREEARMLEEEDARI